MTPAQLAKLTQSDEDGIMYSPSFEIALYSDQPCARLASPAIACYHAFLEGFGSDVSYFLASAMTRPRKFSLTKREVFPTLCLDDKLATLPMFRVFRGDDRLDYSPPVFMTGGFAKKFSTLQLHLPAVYIEQPEEALEFVARFASLFPYRAGYAGIGLCWDDLSVDRETMVPPLIRPLIRRYPGLSPGLPRSLSEQYLPPYNWLTLLGPELLAAVGGLSHVKEDLTEKGVTVLEMGHGACIRAGERPELGDRNRQNSLPLYRRVGAYFKPYRTYTAIRLKGLDFDETEEWLARFDS